MILSGVILLLLLLPGCRRGSTVATTTPAPTVTPTLPPTVAATSDAYLAIFDVVWQTVNDSFFDPDFGGVDWQVAHDQYEPLIARAENEKEFFQLLNQMLWELEVSHTAAGPADVWPSVEPAIWMEGKTGLDVRLLDGKVVVTRVEPDSPAEQAGVRPGFVLERVGGTPVEQIIAEAESERAPPYNDSGRIDQLTRTLLGRIYGTPGTCVSIAWLDEDEQLHEKCLMRLQRERPAAIEGMPLPGSYLEFETRRLEDNIGYVRFNTFHPELIPEVIAAVQSMQDAPAIIIDLRGNPGGYLPAVEALAAQFFQEQVSLGSWQTREGTLDWLIQPGDRPYEGQAIILIDALSFSGSECFASVMQAIGRAVVVGVRSPGGVTGANIARLPNDGLLMVPVVQLITPAGDIPEGSGVVPDIEVELERDLLLQGIDSQIEAAIDYVGRQDAP